MSRIRILLPLVLLAAPGVGEGDDKTDDVIVKLAPGVPTPKVRLGYSKARPVPIESTAPRFLFEIPKFQAKDPLFFRVAMGESKGEPFYGALDRSKTGDYHDLLYIDRNRDQDLTNDGEPIRGRVRTYWQDNRKLVEFLGVVLDVPHTVAGLKVSAPYPCVLYFVTEPKKTPTTIQIERDGWRHGRLRIHGQDYVLVLIDDDCDGNYTTGDTWSIKPAGTEMSELMDRGATRSMLFPGWTKDEKWTVEVKAIDLSGSQVTLRAQPAKEAENAFFLRLYRARQTEEERQLKLDPMRPKADPKDQVKWLKGEDVKYALKIANSPNVKKRILLHFMSNRCIWCARMAKYTFRDREVVQLTEKFVCSELKFQQGVGESGKRQVEGTPTYIILDLDASEITRHQGFLRPAEFAAWLKSALR